MLSVKHTDLIDFHSEGFCSGMFIEMLLPGPMQIPKQIPVKMFLPKILQEDGITIGALYGLVNFKESKQIIWLQILFKHAFRTSE